MAGLESEPRPSKRKRHQYTRRACNGCKVRKVKCSGVVPCSRCTDTGTDCIYFDSTTAAHEIGSIEINKIRRVDALPSDRLQNLERFVRVVQEGLSQVATTSSIPFGGPSESQRIPPSPALTDLPSKNKSRLWTRRRWSSPFARKVPTSFEAMLKLAQSSFVEDIIPNINEETTSLNSHTPPIEDEETAVALVHAGHAILALGRSTALSLVDAFASHVGVMYPCVDMASTQSNIVCLFDLKSNSARGTIPSLRLIDIEILKAIMMVGASAKCSEPSSLAEHLEQSLSWSVENVCSQELLGLEDAIMSCLMCIYFLQRDEREKAWRMAGFSARTVSELGLDAHEPPEAHSWHKSDSDFESNESFDLRCRLLYCCVYDLDSWCSFLTGLPRVLSLRLPPDHLGYLQSRSHNFLRAMLEMDCIGADIIDFLKEPDQAADPHGTRMDYLEFRLKNMECASLGDTLSRKEAQDWAMPTALQLFIQLRANHLRLSTQLRSLASARMAAIRPRAVKALVSAASDNIWVCKAMESESMPTLLRPTFVHFLMGAVSGMLLAASYDPIMYGFNSRHPFKTALEMLETLSDKFRGVDPQQQYSVADLRKLGQKFGIVDEDASDHGSLNEDSALNPLIALGLQNASSDATIEQSWDASCEDPFTIGGINAQLQWEEERFDFVFNDYGAEAHDSGLYST